MNTDLMFSSKTDMWSTPQKFFDDLDKEFCFTLDVCATLENAKCKAFYTKDQDGLAQKWTGCVCGVTLPTAERWKSGLKKRMSPLYWVPRW